MFKRAGPANAEPPRVELKTVDGAATLFLYGQWTVYTYEDGKKALRGFAGQKSGQGSGRAFNRLDLGGVSRMDTSGALLVNGLLAPRAGGDAPGLENGNPDIRAILELSHKSYRLKEPREAGPNLVVRTLNSAGHKILTELALIVDILSFLGQMNVGLLKSLRRRKAVNPAALVNQIEQTGVRAVPIVSLLNFLIGLVIAYMAAAQLILFGAQIFVVNLLEVGVLREMGVLITAIMVAGRSGSAFTAQIGAMVSNEEVRAMRSMGIDPMARLVLPRVLALLISMPFLVIIADIMALLGGLFAMWFSMGISPTVFIHNLHESITLRHLLVGVLKAPFFAVIIGCVGCFLGFKATGSSESIGALTTRSVVESIFLVIALDAVFALILSTIGV